MKSRYVWLDGKTFVAQGTVGQDATAGTHVASMTIVPGLGSEMFLLYANIQVGNTATAQFAQCFIDDGTNVISVLMNPGGTTNTVAGENYSFPGSGNVAVSALNADIDMVSTGMLGPISGTMRLVLRTNTTQISVTQTFAAAVRCRGQVPAVTLTDTVGTPVLTTNVSRVF